MLEKITPACMPGKIKNSTYHQRLEKKFLPKQNHPYPPPPPQKSDGRPLTYLYV